jgi:DNA-directed RNA polymerase specialized sigma24 family protein
MHETDSAAVKETLLDDPVLQVIPEMDRIIVRMRAFGLSPEEIALVTGSTPGAVDEKLSGIEKRLNEFKSLMC